MLCLDILPFTDTTIVPARQLSS